MKAWLCVVGLVASASASASCGSDDHVRTCDMAEDCVQGGVAGQCLASTEGTRHFCAYPDVKCASGQRWGALAGDGLATECVDPSATSVKVTISKIGEGAGVVTSSTGGLDCGAVCTIEVPRGTKLTLSAAEDAESFFEGWKGATCSGRAACEATIDAETTIEAEFAKSGKMRWFNQISPGGRCEVTDVVVTKKQEFFAVGIQLLGLEGAGIFVRKLDAMGHEAWTRRFVGQPEGINAQMMIYGVAADSKGDVFVLGQYDGSMVFGPYVLKRDFVNSSSETHLFLAKISGSDGTPQWATKFAVVNKFDPSRKGIAFTLDPEGNCYVLAQSRMPFSLGGKSVDPYQQFVAGFSKDGAVLFSRGLSNNATDVVVRGVTYGGNPPYLSVVGTFSKNHQWSPLFLNSFMDTPDGFVAKLSPTDGVSAYVRAFGTSASETFTEISPLPDGRAVIAVEYANGPTNFGLQDLPGKSGMGMLIVSQASAPLFAVGFEADNAKVVQVKAGSRNDFWLSGNFSGKALIGSPGLQANSNDAFVIRLAADGIPIRVLRFGGPMPPTTGAGLAIGASSILVGGRFSSIAEFGDMTQKAVDSWDGYVVGLVP